MDAFLIARYQSLVNLFQRKPIWWIEQCAYVLLLCGCGKFFFRTQADGLNWITVLFFIMDLGIFGYCWYAGRHEAFKEHVFGPDQTFVRTFFALSTLIYVGLEVVGAMFGHPPSPLSILANMSSASLTSCFFFGACLPPPPPKPRTKMAFNRGGA